MTTYTIFAYESYEGASSVFDGTLEECKTWIKNKPRYYALDDLEIYSNDAPDVYELYNSE